MTAATRDAGRMPNARRSARRERNAAIRRQMAIEAEARRGGLATAAAWEDAMNEKQKLTAQVNVWRDEVMRLSQALRSSTVTAKDAMRHGARRTELGHKIREAEDRLAEIERQRRAES